MQHDENENLRNCQPRLNHLSLADFQNDHKSALLNFAINSGLDRFHLTSQLYGETNVINETYPGIADIIEQLKTKIKEDLPLGIEEDIVNNFQKIFSLKAPLLSCASCGIRQFELGLESTKGYQQLSLDRLTQL